MPGNPIGEYALPTVIADAATQVFDCSQSGYYTWTMGANRTMSGFTNPVAGQRVILELKQDATGSRIMTWPANVSWATNGTAPTLTTTANHIDVLSFLWNPTLAKWRGSVVGLDMA